jgi:hypothetical protein
LRVVKKSAIIWFLEHGVWRLSNDNTYRVRAASPYVQYPAKKSEQRFFSKQPPINIMGNCVTPDVKKPSDINDYLKLFVDELIELSTKGFYFNGKLFL